MFISIAAVLFCVLTVCWITVLTWLGKPETTAMNVAWLLTNIIAIAGLYFFALAGRVPHLIIALIVSFVGVLIWLALAKRTTINKVILRTKIPRLLGLELWLAHQHPIK
jgi:hypothetical protein